MASSNRAEGESSERGSGAAGPTPIRVVLCDDHPLFLAGLRDLLRSDPTILIVLEAHSLAELRAKVRAIEFDLALLDLGLPDGSGLEAVAELAARGRVLVLSAVDEPSTIRTAFQRGATGFLRKDSIATDVLAAVRRASGGQTVLSSEQALAVATALREDTERNRYLRGVDSLSERQREVLELLARGLSNREIAQRLFVSEGTVKNHVTLVLRALDVGDRTRLALLVSRHGLPS